MTKTHILHLYCEPEPAVSTAAARKGYQSSQMIDITRRSTLSLYGELKTSSDDEDTVNYAQGFSRTTHPADTKPERGQE